MSASELRGWLDLKHAAEYLCLSVRTLRSYIGHDQHPLPCRLVGNKWLMHQQDLDQWVHNFPGAGEDVARVVDEVIAELKK
jgi:hypothetical protein